MRQQRIVVGLCNVDTLLCQYRQVEFQIVADFDLLFICKQRTKILQSRFGGIRIIRDGYEPAVVRFC